VKRSLIGLAAFSLLAIGPGLFAQDVKTSPHNLSKDGPGPIKAASEGQVCIFCHAPHHGAQKTPLWNRRDPGTVYTTYRSTTLKAPQPGQPTGSSRQCLSCHDGTIALGEVANRKNQVAMATGVATMLTGRTLIGADLSSHHPISFNYAASVAAGAELNPTPRLGAKSLLDPSGAVQCTSCHDPHDDEFGNFLVGSNQRSALCTGCHAPASWQTSPHATATSTWNGQNDNPWPASRYTTVGDNGCESCHTPHAAQSKFQLVRQPTLTQACNVCHNANVAKKSVAGELTKWSTHAMGANPGVHDAAEAIDGRATHVECVDCHEPHRAGTSPTTGPLESSLVGARGMSLAGVATNPAAAEYEVCFRCHSDDLSTNPNRIARVIPQPNHRLQFTIGNPSFHPVATQGMSTNVPSLIAPMSNLTTIRCTSCHNNDSGPAAGGAGPAGPHGSVWSYLLEEQYQVKDLMPESYGAYSLCYKCHDRNSILADASFRAVGATGSGHQKHVVTDQTSCSVCHDPHGISQTLGSPLHNARLINFDAGSVSANSKGVLSFTYTPAVGATPSSSKCSLKCHNHDHDGSGY
jgi:predicted CXXCH cytochrome family protein